MNEPESTPGVPASKKRRAWIVGIMLGLLLVAGLVIRVALHQGWSASSDRADVSAVAADPQGQAWAAEYREGPGRLMYYSPGGKPEEITLPGELARASMRSLTVDGRGQLWVGTEEGVIGMRDGAGQWRVYRPENPDTDNPVWDLVIDGQGRVWARSNRGPGRIDETAENSPFSFTNSGLAENNASAMATDEKGQLWVLTRKRELKVLAPDGEWTTQANAPDTAAISPPSSALAIDPQGKVWVEANQGVDVLDPAGRWTSYALGDPGLPLAIQEILPDREGRVWVASEVQGIFMYDPGTGWTTYQVGNSGLGSNSIKALAIDGKGQIWIGTLQGGLSKFDPGAALPASYIPAFSLIGNVIIPAALLGIVLLAAFAAAFSGPVARPGRSRRDFSIAFAGWFAVNALLWAWIRMASAGSGMVFIHPLVLLPLVLNPLALIVFFLTRRWMAFGALSAFVANWIGIILVTPVTDSPGAVWKAIAMIPFFLGS